MDPRITEWLMWAAQTPEAQRPGSMKPMLFMMGGIFMLAYFMLIRPQKQEQRRRKEMVDTLGKGDSVVTSGGIHGTIESVDKEKGVVTVNVAPKINMKFNRAAVSTVIKKKGKPKEETEKSDQKR